MPTNYRFSKINVGSVNHHGRHDLSHDIATTADFGYCQPLFGKFMIGGSKIKSKFDTKVRVMPMPLPPFGSCNLRFFSQFVPCDSLLPSYNAFRAGSVYNSPYTSYVPNSLPYIRVSTGTSSDTPTSLSLMSIVCSPFFSNYIVYECSSYSSSISSSSSVFTGNIDYSAIVSDTTISYTDINSRLHMSFITNLSGFSSSNRILSSDVGVHILSGEVPTLNNCDFMFVIPKQASGSSSDYYIILIRLTQQGRQFRKILNTLGTQLSTVDYTNVSVMPLFAYYKAWFDIMMPQRDITWTSTNAYAILDKIADFNISDLNLLSTPSSAGSHVTTSTFCEFCKELSECYASFEPNYFSSSILSPNNSGIQVDNSVEFNRVGDALTESLVQGSSFTGYPNIVEHADNSNFRINRVGLQIVNSLGRWVNTNNVIGRNLKEFFSKHFGQNFRFDDESYFCGNGSLPIQLGDVLLTANTETGQAGDYAGVGFGSGDFKVRYSAKKDGYLIVICSVIPVSNYVQGSEYDNYLLSRLQIPQPDFDCLGYDKVLSHELVHQCFVGANLSVQGSQVFGYQPRYTGHKVKKSVMTGDFTLASTRYGKLGFTLDNYISQDVVNVNPVSDNVVNFVVSNPRSDLIQSGIQWRWAGKYKFLSNYGRIFYDQPEMSVDARVSLSQYGGNFPVDDGFLIYSQCSCKYSTPLHSIAESYDTNDGSYVDHE